MAKKRTHGRTAGGRPITEEMVRELVARAEAGYDIDETLRRRQGRPTLGSAPAVVASVRLEPELREALVERAKREHQSTSSLLRKALRRYLEAS